MTTAEAADRLLRHASTQDPAALTRTQANELMGALGYAVVEYFRTGPAMLRQTSASATLPAPATVSGLSVAAGAHEVSSGTPFTLAQRGASLEIAGDKNRNEIVSTVGWLNPYQGTGGTGKTATVYGDCVPISSRVIERITSEPWILDDSNSRGEKRELVRVQRDHLPPERYRESIGIPEYYAILPAGVSRGATTQWLIRVWPAPQRQLVLRFECEVQPEMFDADALAEVVLDLPFSDAQMETILLPIAEERLLASTLFDEVSDRTASTLAAYGQKARDFLAKLPRDHGRPRGRVMTKPGY